MHKKIVNIQNLNDEMGLNMILGFSPLDRAIPEIIVVQIEKKISRSTGL